MGGKLSGRVGRRRRRLGRPNREDRPENGCSQKT